jgi:hypothetical protein
MRITVKVSMMRENNRNSFLIKKVEKKNISKRKGCTPKPEVKKADVEK